VVKQERTKRNYERTKAEQREVSEVKERQRRFADEYLIDLNAEAAAVRAGYSPRYARGNAYKLVARSGIKEYIAKRMAEKESELIADQDEGLLREWQYVIL
jgi:phage terminase small subunit